MLGGFIGLGIGVILAIGINLLFQRSIDRHRDKIMGKPNATREGGL
jgi:hypothetical protein